ILIQVHTLISYFCIKSKSIQFFPKDSLPQNLFLPEKGKNESPSASSGNVSISFSLFGKRSMLPNMLSPAFGVTGLSRVSTAQSKQLFEANSLPVVINISFTDLSALRSSCAVN
ncbi:MAG: hypothetical protein IJ181_00420, partial [Acidaminococcaceae bacterium]|nr:hypothetical protein [Acidaminococcaceae bacterium]